jgi:hypothetical protein
VKAWRQILSWDVAPDAGEYLPLFFGPERYFLHFPTMTYVRGDVKNVSMQRKLIRKLNGKWESTGMHGEEPLEWTTTGSANVENLYQQWLGNV